MQLAGRELEWKWGWKTNWKCLPPALKMSPLKSHEGGQCSLRGLVKTVVGPEVGIRHPSGWVGNLSRFSSVPISAYWHLPQFTTRRKAIHFVFPWHVIAWKHLLPCGFSLYPCPATLKKSLHWALVFLIYRVRTVGHVTTRIPSSTVCVCSLHAKICWTFTKCQAGCWAQSVALTVSKGGSWLRRWINQQTQWHQIKIALNKTKTDF